MHIKTHRDNFTTSANRKYPDRLCRKSKTKTESGKIFLSLLPRTLLQSDTIVVYPSSHCVAQTKQIFHRIEFFDGNTLFSFLFSKVLVELTGLIVLPINYIISFLSSSEGFRQRADIETGNRKDQDIQTISRDVWRPANNVSSPPYDIVYCWIILQHFISTIWC